MTHAFCLLGLSGSLRRAATSTAVLHGLQDALAPDDLLDEIRARQFLRPSA
jgi:hypothetical protein